MDDLTSRVAVLEQIARSTQTTLNEIHKDIRELRADNRWLLGIMLGGFAAMLGGFAGVLGAMAHGFHWL